jgi:Zn finger protein HypA/HybF involved in hydrogenase expression
MSKEVGIIYAPYVFKEHTEESLREHQKVMAEYSKKHNYCPKCGSGEYITSLVGYPLVSGKEAEYKDKNTCKCTACGDTHIVHDRTEE